MKYLLYLLLAAIPPASLAGAQPLLQQYPASTGIERFIPVGWALTQSVTGDLNGDGIEDLAAALLRGDEASASPVEQAGARGLLVLFADGSGGFRYQDFAPDALPCASCLEDLAGSPRTQSLRLGIANERLTVRWVQAVDEIKEVKLNIAYDQQRGAMRLIGDKIRTTDSLSGKSSTLTHNYEAGTRSSDGKVSKVTPRFIPLIEVSAEDY